MRMKCGNMRSKAKRWDDDITFWSEPKSIFCDHGPNEDYQFGARRSLNSLSSVCSS